MIFIIKYY